MSDPGYRISDFFTKMGKVKNNDDFNVFMKQYWYVWFIICIIIVIMVIINVLMIVYFRRRSRPYKKPEGNNDKAPQAQTIMVPQKVKQGTPLSQEYNETNSQFAMEALIANNKYRTIHNVPPLKYNENLSKIAQSWAETMGKMQKMQHSPPNWRKYKSNQLGENLAYLFNAPLTGEKMIDMWYAEAVKHDFTLDKQEASQNFSQLVWKGSKEVGFGRVKSANGDTWYGVAMYMSAGNIVGYYGQNVFQQ